jgi:hypothetical protein
LNLVYDKSGTIPYPRFPARIVLNNRTISIYNTADFEHVYESYDLDKIRISEGNVDKSRCFKITDQRDENKHA